MNYTIREVKPWKDGQKTVKDDYGHILMSVTFEEKNNEPTDYRSKVVPNPGDVLEGRIIPYTTQNGNSRMKFVEEAMNPHEQRMQAQWGIGRALENAPDHEDLDKLQALAEGYIALVNKIVGD